MKFLNTAELQAVLPSAWGVADEADTNLVRDLARRYPGMMRRIHDIASLIASKFGLPSWLAAEITVGVTPIDLLRQGEDGLRRLDAIMVDQFRAVAPRDLFDVPGAVTDVGGEGELIVRLLQDRDGSEPGGSGDIHDPMRFDRLVTKDAGKRLAAAVGRYLREQDTQIARKMAYTAMRDSDADIRRAAIAASAWLLGYSEVLEAVGAMHVDDDRAIRLEAVRALTSMSERLEVASELAMFLQDIDETVRLAAITGFVGKKLAAGTTLLLLPAVFDPNPEIARLARLVVPEAEIIHHFRGITADLSAGRAVSRADLAMLAASEYLSDEEKDEAVVPLIVSLAEHGETERLTTLLTLAGYKWSGEHTALFWIRLANCKSLIVSGDLRGSLVSLLKEKGENSLAWPLIEALLHTPIDRRFSDIAQIIATTVALGRRVPHFILQLIRCAGDRMMDESYRYHIVHNLGDVGVSKAVADAMRIIFMDSTEVPRIAREALVTAVKVVGPEEKAALIALSRTSPHVEVRDYAAAAQAGLLRPEPEKTPVGESADIIDLKAARRRRSKAPAGKAGDQD